MPQNNAIQIILATQETNMATRTYSDLIREKGSSLNEEGFISEIKSSISRKEIFETEDGERFDSENDAELHQLKLVLEQLCQEYGFDSHDCDTPVVEAENIFIHAEEFGAVLLQILQRLEE